MFKPIALVLAVTAAAPAFAEPKASPGGGKITITSIDFYNRTSAGRHVGCELEYKLWFPDYYSRRGETVGLIGSIALLSLKQGIPPVIILKAQGLDFIGNSFQRFETVHAHLSVEHQSLAGKEYIKFQCEDGGACVGYDSTHFKALIDGLNSSFSISFLRAGANTDIAVPLKIDSANAERFMGCTANLIKSVETEIDGEQKPKQ